MIEAGVQFGDIRLEKPTVALRQVSNDLQGTQPLQLASGRTITALALQERFAETARAFITKEGGCAEDLEVLDLWERAVGAIVNDDLDPVSTELDWVIKHRLLERYRERTGAQWSDAWLARLDLAYSDRAAERGSLDRLQ